MYTLEELKLKLREWTEEYAQSYPIFLVDIILKGTKYEVYIDTMQNVTVDECAKLNRYLQKQLDEDAGVPEIYTLDVSSPGMSNPLKVLSQYKKRIGKDLHFWMKDGSEFVADIIQVNEEYIDIQIKTPADKKKKIPESIIDKKINISEIKKALIPFKINKK